VETVLSARQDRLRIDTDRSQFSYQLVSRPFTVGPGADYLLEYDIDIVTGGATVGIIDGEARSWIVQTNLAPGRNAGGVHFVARSGLAEVVIANYGLAEKVVSRIEVASLRVSEAERAAVDTFAATSRESA
jgi:hypothetical protein